MSERTPDWWELRPAGSTKPATYRCPLCGELLPALSEHVLLKPEGDSSRRRHAHTRCVAAARRAGRLPTRAEFLRNQPRERSQLLGAFARLLPRRRRADRLRDRGT